MGDDKMGMTQACCCNSLDPLLSLLLCWVISGYLISPPSLHLFLLYCFPLIFVYLISPAWCKPCGTPCGRIKVAVLSQEPHDIFNGCLEGKPPHPDAITHHPACDELLGNKGRWVGLWHEVRLGWVDDIRDHDTGSRRTLWHEGFRVETRKNLQREDELCLMVEIVMAKLYNMIWNDTCTNTRLTILN